MSRHWILRSCVCWSAGTPRRVHRLYFNLDSSVNMTFPISFLQFQSLKKRGKNANFSTMKNDQKWLRLGSFGLQLWALQLSHNNKQHLIWFPWNGPNKFWPKKPIFRPISCKKSLKTEKFLEKNRLFQDLTLDYL